MQTLFVFRVFIILGTEICLESNENSGIEWNKAHPGEAQLQSVLCWKLKAFGFSL